ncbi:MAG TPA: hypothetical protein VEH27_17365 [Methylomirabilota bacterium]|nr:hypothetical protein [Methylomirabilota bacterium]
MKYLVIIVSALQCLGLAFAQPASESATPVPAVRQVELILCEEGAFKVRFPDGNERDIPSGVSELEQVTFRVSGPSVWVKPLVSDIQVTARSVGGWQVDLAQNVAATFTVHCRKGRVEVAADADNLLPAVIVLKEGGHVELRASAKATAEFFSNGSYLIRGEGEALARNADGQKIHLGEPGALMTGGPLVQVINSKGNPDWERVSPISKVRLSGSASGEVKVTAGKQTVTISGGGKRSVQIPETGSVIVFEELANRKGYSLFVEKGEFRVSIEGVLNWTAIASTDQRAELTWNRLDRSVDIRNLSSSRMVSLLPSRNFVEIDPGAQFQYSWMIGQKFATAATGGDVKMYSRDGAYNLNLRNSNQVFTITRDDALIRKPGLPLHLNWDTGAPLSVNASVDYAQLKPGSEHVVRFGQEGEAHLYYSEGGFLRVAAAEHKFSLKIESLNGLLVELEAGDEVQMILDRRKGTFTLQTGIDNSFTVGVDTQNGFAPQVGANRAINFNIKKDGAMTTTASGFLVNYTPGAEDPLLNDDHDPLIPDRVDQTPVSVVR